MKENLFKIIMPILSARFIIGLVEIPGNKLSIATYIGTGLSGALLGFIIGVIIDLFRRPRKIRVVIDHKDLNNNTSSVADELIKINTLLKEAAITNEEFEKLKVDILKKR